MQIVIIMFWFHILLRRVTVCYLDVSNKMPTQTLPVNMTDINPFITMLSVLSPPIVLPNDIVLSQFQNTSQYIPYTTDKHRTCQLL